MGLGRVENAWTKCLANEKDVFWPFMDLEKAYRLAWYVADAKSYGV